MSEEKAEEAEKSILELQSEIETFKRKERAYIVQLHYKDEIIKKLTNLKKTLTENLEEISDYSSEKTKQNLYSNPVMLEYFKQMSDSLNEIEKANLRREEEIPSLKSADSEKKFYRKARRLIKDNDDLFQYMNGNYIENMRHDNDLEKSQIDQLMLKLKDQETITNDYLTQIDQAEESKEFLKRKIKAQRMKDEKEEMERKSKRVKI